MVKFITSVVLLLITAGCTVSFATAIAGPPYAAQWIDKVSVTESAGVLTKTSGVGWNAGANTSNLLAANTDGWIEFTINSTTNRYLLGFGAIDGGFLNTDFNNGIQFLNGTAYSTEGAVSTSIGTYLIGDVIRISREVNQVKYYKNGISLRTLTVNPALQLRAKVSIYSGSSPAVTTSFDSKIRIQATVVSTGNVNSGGNISLNVDGGTVPYTYSWSSGETTANITNKVQGSYTVTVTDAALRVEVRTFTIGYKPYWIDNSNVTESNGVLTKTSAIGWNAGANSSNVLPANVDGSIEFIAPNTISRYIIGFGVIEKSFINTNFRNAIHINSNGLVDSYEGSTITALGSWQAGDVFKIARVGTTVTYYKNGTALRNITVSSGFELKAKSAIYSGSSPVVTSTFNAKFKVISSVVGTGYVNGTGSCTITPSGGTSPYTYAWSSGETTNTITNKNRGLYTVTITDAEGRTQNVSCNVGYKPYWINQIGVNENSGSLTKTNAVAWGTSGANSSNLLPANTDGWIEVRATTGGVYEIGFETNMAAFSNTVFENGLYFDYTAGTARMYEGSALTAITNWYEGDVFKISREGSMIKYYRNGSEIRSVSVNAALALRVKSAMYSGTAPTVTTSFDAKLVLRPTINGATTSTGTGSMTMNVTGGTAPYTYSWLSGEQTSTISNKARGQYTVTVTDAEGHTTGNVTYNLGYKSYWTGFTGSVTDVNGVLTRTSGSGWNAGAYSSNMLPANTDGWVEFITPANSLFEIGFTTDLVGYGATTFTNAIFCDNYPNVVRAYESSTNTSLNNWLEGEVFRISREGSSVKYYRNGVVIRTVTVSPSLQLRVKASINTGSAPLVNSSFWMPATEGNVPDIAEFQILKQVYDSLGGSGWTTKTNWPTIWPTSATSAQMATWYGVTVTNNDITAINLSANNLAGKIPASVFTLSSLNSLLLNNNALVNKVPSTISQATALTKLHLHNNQLTGVLPSLANQTLLTELLLSNNSFTAGAIPSWLGNLTSLNKLELRNTNRTGVLPDVFKTMPNLQKLDLANNALDSAINVDFPTNLVTLDVGYNQFTGTLPLGLNGLTKLTYLYLNNNQFIGTIPEWFGDLTDLQVLMLHVNQLEGSIPPRLANLSKLTHLFLHTNQLTGELPASLGYLTELQAYYVSDNFLSGSIPVSYSSLTKLVYFYVQNNLLSGAVPDIFTNWNQLVHLNISRNKFTALPTSVGNLASLTTFYGSNNQLEIIPASVLNLAALTTFQADTNNISDIPNFANQVNKVNLSVNVSNNYLSFAELEPVFATSPHGIATFTYHPQKKFNISKLHIPSGSLLEITAASKGNNSTVTWEKKDGTSWTNVNALSENQTLQSYKISNVNINVNGTYRWTMNNSAVTGTTLQSEEIEVLAVDALSGEEVTPLYNGLITAARWRTESPEGVSQGDLSGMYRYAYDEKYQIKDANWYDNDNILGYVQGGNKNRITNMGYDPNGNITTMHRFDEKGLLKNDFTYTYDNSISKPTWNNQETNQLKEVSGYVREYKYNKIGQMTEEYKVEEGADQFVEYDVTGKVRKVYAEKNPTTGALSKLKVEYKYDDRGFRLAKITYPLSTGEGGGEARTTWYIRDASGNVLSIYEQEGKPTDAEQTNTHEPVETEVPVYGSGKLATVYPAQDYSTTYELTDHLGNVRALVRENVNVYTATMEDNGRAEETNPRVEEMAYFNNLFETERKDQLYNHTPGGQYSSYLLWGNTEENKSVGPSIMLKVQAGDTINAETWVRYEDNASTYARNMLVPAIASVLTGNFSYSGVFEGSTLAQTTSSFQSGLLAGAFGSDTENETPFAYLNYIIFKNDMTVANAGWERVTDASAGQYSKIEFANPIQIPADGYMYIWVSNETQGTQVWFDDVKVTHTQTIVTQATDYGVWGDVLTELKSEEITYRHGYQGQFAEKDEETGWNHFEAREYDPIIGRWMKVDFERQFFSPYLAFSNNPIYYIDKDGNISMPPLWKIKAVGIAALNTGGGALEVFVGGSSLVASSGATSVASVLVIADGVSRTALGFSNLLMALAAENEEQYKGLSVPSNLGGIAGAILDHTAGHKSNPNGYEKMGTIANDFVSIAAGNFMNTASIPKWAVYGEHFYLYTDAATAFSNINYIQEDTYRVKPGTDESIGQVLLVEIVITGKRD